MIVLDGGGVDEEGKLTATGDAAPSHEAEGAGMWRMPTGSAWTSVLLQRYPGMHIIYVVPVEEFIFFKYG